MDTWLENILNGYADFERETVKINAAADDGKTSEIESFGYEKNLIIVEVYHVADWYFGDITCANSISGDNTGEPGADLTKVGQTSIVKNEVDSLYYGYAAFAVPQGSAGGDDYAAVMKIFNSDQNIDYFEVSVMTTVVQAWNQEGGNDDDDEGTGTYMWLFPVLIVLLCCLVAYFSIMPSSGMVVNV